MAKSHTLLRRWGTPVRTRKKWGAKHPPSSNRKSGKDKLNFLHISVTNRVGTINAQVRQIERIGAQRFPNTRMSYTDLLDKKGRIYRGQPSGRKGAHTVNNKGVFGWPNDLNAISSALCIIGNVEHKFNDKMVEAAARWVAARYLAGECSDKVIYGHRTVARKACPGDKAYARLDEIDKRAAEIIAAGGVTGSAAKRTKPKRKKRRPKSVRGALGAARKARAEAREKNKPAMLHRVERAIDWLANINKR